MASFLLLQDNADPVLLGDHDVALASIDKVVAGEAISTDREMDTLLRNL